MTGLEIAILVVVCIGCVFVLVWAGYTVYGTNIDKETLAYLKARENRQRKDTGWICVDDELPKPWKEVIALTVDNGMFVGVIDENGRWTNFYRDFKDNQVLYWRDAPDPPEKMGQMVFPA